MNSVLTMTQRKNSNLNGSGGNEHGSDHGAMINALRKLYDPILEEPVPEFLLRAASMTRDEAQRVLAKREDDAQVPCPGSEAAPGTGPRKRRL